MTETATPLRSRRALADPAQRRRAKRHWRETPPTCALGHPMRQRDRRTGLPYCTRCKRAAIEEASA